MRRRRSPARSTCRRRDKGLAPGTYTLRIHSPDHETVFDSVRISRPGEVVTKDGRAGLLLGAWVRHDETDTTHITLRDATWRRMPEVPEGLDSWRLVDERGAELPLFFVRRFGAQSYHPDLPPKGSFPLEPK